jgi:hypothetical protein
MTQDKHTTKAAIDKACRELIPGLRPITSNFPPAYHLPTILGTLYIYPCDRAIRTRFAEVPDIAPVGAPLNPYSGKWNHELLDDASDVARAIHWINRISAAIKEVA